VAALAHALGMTVTMEGIETAAQAAAARRAGCDRGQGFHFARPLPAAAIGELLARADGPGSPPDHDRVDG
jgi:EAL domain-containing protein (putative c-di-GMP-specific phosphodiesterase class I)